MSDSLESYISKNQSSYEEQSAARVLKIMYVAFPVGYLIVTLTSLFYKVYITLYFIPGALLIAFLSFWLLRQGRTQLSASCFIGSLTLLVTGLCSFGQGIHDIGIITYSSIIVMSSLFLQLKNQFIMFGLIILGICWLALGDQFNWYQPEPIGLATYGDLVIILTILFFSVLITISVAGRVQKGLHAAENEVAKRRVRATELESAFAAKTRVTNAVHKQVVQSLSVIYKTIGMIENSPSSPPFYQSLRQRIMAIELIHEQLYQRGSENSVDLETYLKQLLESIEMGVTGSVESKTFDIAITIEQAMSIGLYLWDVTEANQQSLHLVVKLIEREVQMEIHAPNIQIPTAMMSDIMVKQVKGQLIQPNPSMLVFSFPQNQVQG